MIPGQYLAPPRAVNVATVGCYQHGTAGRWMLWHLPLVQQSLLMAGDDDRMFMTRSLYVTPKTTEQHLVVRSDKSVAYVTNNKRLRLTFCTVEANYWQTRSIGRPLCNSRATCMITFALSDNTKLVEKSCMLSINFVGRCQYRVGKISLHCQEQRWEWLD